MKNTNFHIAPLSDHTHTFQSFFLLLPIVRFYLCLCVLVSLCLFSVHDALARPMKAVTTIGQITDAVERVGGERVSVEGLMGPGVDPHLYKASAGDVGKLAEADVIFYNGLHLEAKMAGVFEKMKRSKEIVAVTKDISRDKLLDSEDYPGQHDPHVWFNTDLWLEVVETIYETLARIDPEGRSYYESRFQDYAKKIEELGRFCDGRAGELFPQQRVLITAHDAFRYFGKRYGFEVMGLQGISTEAEAGIKDVSNLADIIVERKIRAIFVESSVSERNVRAVQEAVRARGWNVKIGGELFSDAMGEPGTPEGTYTGMVRHNINTIVEALKGE